MYMQMQMKKSPSQKNVFQKRKPKWLVVNSLRGTVKDVRDRELLVKNLPDALSQEAKRYRQLYYKRSSSNISATVIFQISVPPFLTGGVYLTSLFPLAEERTFDLIVNWLTNYLSSVQMSVSPQD